MGIASHHVTRLAAAVLLFAGCGKTDDARATADIIDPGGQRIGTATFRMIEEGVLLSFDVHDLPPGEHGFHIHEVGKCEPPDFTSAGGHFNPANTSHGMADSRGGAHMGDMLNLVVNNDGTAEGYRVLPRAVLDADASENSLLRESGTAIVIHAQPDDYRTDPAGAAGARIACGVIEGE